GWMVAHAEAIAERNHLSRFISAQNEYNVLQRAVVDRDLIPPCQEFGIGILPYFPLASGLLTGKYEEGAPPPPGSRLAAWGPRADRMLNTRNFTLVKALRGFAHERGHTLLDLAMSWLSHRPTVDSVIAGATSAEQVAQNVAANTWSLSAEDMAEIDRIT